MCGQLFTVLLVALGIGIAVPLWTLLGLIALIAGTNYVLHRWYRGPGSELRRDWWTSRGEALAGWLLAVDIVLLSVLLYVSGGPTNPFSIFYVANIVLAAVMLRPRWVLGLTGFALLCYA
ncbi:MAG: hypothetical protein KDA28_14945, partial [Phycisphaerales bacterium]|nr:hypothetical protein [Phycisphaerales bacterium]